MATHRIRKQIEERLWTWVIEKANITRGSGNKYLVDMTFEEALEILLCQVGY